MIPVRTSPDSVYKLWATTSREVLGELINGVHLYHREPT